MSRLDDAVRAYDAEVEAEAVKLIEGGMPPFDAMEQARSNVRVRRMQKVRDDKNANAEAHGRRSRTVQPIVGASGLEATCTTSAK